MSYTYRVTSQQITLTDGRKAYVAKYAYKPYRGWDGEKANARLHFKTGCVASENMKLQHDLIVTIDEEKGTGTLWSNRTRMTVFDDDSNFGSERMPKLNDIVRQPNGKWAYKQYELTLRYSATVGGVSISNTVTRPWTDGVTLGNMMAALTTELQALRFSNITVTKV